MEKCRYDDEKDEWIVPYIKRKNVDLDKMTSGATMIGDGNNNFYSVNNSSAGNGGGNFSSGGGSSLFPDIYNPKDGNNNNNNNNPGAGKWGVFGLLYHV